eukprot:SAG31_NODE_6177_length_2136_cov_1.305351_1_plen_185_part_00
MASQLRREFSVARCERSHDYNRCSTECGQIYRCRQPIVQLDSWQNPQHTTGSRDPMHNPCEQCRKASFMILHHVNQILHSLTAPIPNEASRWKMGLCSPSRLGHNTTFHPLLGFCRIRSSFTLIPLSRWLESARSPSSDTALARTLLAGWSSLVKRCLSESSPTSMSPGRDERCNLSGAGQSAR